jgi:hypothetical protein
MIEFPNATASAYCDVGWINPTSGQINWSFGGGLMRADAFDAATQTTLQFGSVPDDATMYLRVREDAGTYYWDTSTDGTAYVTVTSTAIDTGTFDPTMASVYVLCSAIGNGMPTNNAGRGVVELLHEVI